MIAKAGAKQVPLFFPMPPVQCASVDHQILGCFLLSAGEECRDIDVMPDHILQPVPDRPSFIDRLANSIAKRKRSTPQKFVGKNSFIFFSFR